jgi:hypothetical protein
MGKNSMITPNNCLAELHIYIDALGLIEDKKDSN